MEGGGEGLICGRLAEVGGPTPFMSRGREGAVRGRGGMGQQWGRSWLGKYPGGTKTDRERRECWERGLESKRYRSRGDGKPGVQGGFVRGGGGGVIKG